MNKLNLSIDELKEFIGEGVGFAGDDVGEFVPESNSKDHELARLNRLRYLLEQYNQASREAGINKWFVPGTPFGIENCPKHQAFFDAGAKYNERVFMAGNRCGKSIAGA